MKRMVIVSNRLHLNVIKKGKKLVFQRSAGGLATGLASFYKHYHTFWIGWPGVVNEGLKGIDKTQIIERLKAERSYPIFLSQKDVDLYYHGFANKTIWPLFHYFPSYTQYNQQFWDGYKNVNQKFCEEIITQIKPQDVVWVHDYHLMLLPRLIRKRMPEATIGFFLHIPFPSYELFRLLPWREEILKGLMGADLIGFHNYDYALNFLNSIRRLLGYEHTIGQIEVNNRIIKVDAFPMGINYEKFAKAFQISKVAKEIARVKEKIGQRKILLSIDRLDYTKGIPQRLEAFEAFLEKYPRFKGKVSLILVVVPSRTKVEYYASLKRQIDEMVGRINGKYSTIGWTPIWYLYRLLPFEQLTALYNVSDVAVITPLRDGMNLIAKEFIASKENKPGMLILSEMAGAVKELGESIVVNPNNKTAFVEAIKTALEMKEEDQILINSSMQSRLKRYNVERWARDFMEKLSQIKSVQHNLNKKMLDQKSQDVIKQHYMRATSSLFFLDYDGTLIPFASTPQEALPDERLLSLLSELSQRAELVIISGRDKDSLEKFFPDLDVSFVAEHGVWIKERNKNWELIEPLQNEWKKEIRPILELYVDRTPGAFIEEKDFSLVWHYRKADPELAVVRARELKDALLHLTSNLNLGILEGNKVIEVKNVGINKGLAAVKWLSRKEWDFILAIGDDWTDEDLFNVLPQKAYSIKVGLTYSKARYNVPSYQQVRNFLSYLADINTQTLGKG